jgi:hypothetical protein
MKDRADHENKYMQWKTKNSTMGKYFVDDARLIAPCITLAFSPEKNMIVYHGRMLITESSHIVILSITISLANANRGLNHRAAFRRSGNHPFNHVFLPSLAMPTTSTISIEPNGIDLRELRSRFRPLCLTSSSRREYSIVRLNCRRKRRRILRLSSEGSMHIL